jgi:hypothetical protein
MSFLSITRTILSKARDRNGFAIQRGRGIVSVTEYVCLVSALFHRWRHLIGTEVIRDILPWRRCVSRAKITSANLTHAAAGMRVV